jgi:transcription antitermination factor NusG
MRIYIRAESGPSAIEAEVNDQEWNSIINGENRTNLYSFQLKPIPVQPQI